MEPVVTRVGPLATVGRGLKGRCGRCGGRGIFDGWFRLRERCPTCSYRFSREEGFFTGVMLVNLSAVLVVLWVLIMGYALWRAATDADSGLAPILVAVIAIGFVMPVAFYPRAASTWAAIDLATRPLEPDEEADALTHRAGKEAS